MSVSPGILNLTLSQGATWNVSMTYTNADGDPIDLTTYSARMQARTSYEAANAILDLSDGDGIILGGTAGGVTISVSAGTTATIPAAQYVYDLELVSASNEVTRLIEGTLIVTPEVTR